MPESKRDKTRDFLMVGIFAIVIIVIIVGVVVAGTAISSYERNSDDWLQQIELG